MTAGLRDVAALIRRETGISLQESQYGALAAAVRRATGGSDAAAFLRAAADPVGGRVAVERLIDEVTVKETSFFRHADELEAIGWRTLLESARAAGRGTVRAWVAACATGEEAYSLAVLACEAFASVRPPVSVLATDISGSALERARAGRYGARAARGLPPRVRERYFVRAGDELEVREEVRSLVRFARHNLVLDPAPPPGEEQFDLILCRNVLIYFELAKVWQVIERLEGALRPQGSLVLGAADAVCGRRPPGQAPPPSPPRPRDETRRRGAPPPSEPPLHTLLDAALRAANQGRAEAALAAVGRLLAADPLDADAYFVRGLVELELGEADAAAASLRRALYVDPTFGVAAFHLGRAHERRRAHEAARRAYEQALRTLEHAEDRHGRVLERVDIADVAAACRARLAASRGPR